MEAVGVEPRASGKHRPAMIGAILSVVVVVVISSSLSAIGHSAGPSDRDSVIPPVVTASVGASELQGASYSLARGMGPASGSDWKCGTSDEGGSYVCSPPTPPSGVPPAQPSADPNWDLQLLSPPARQGASMTYDAADKYVVLFGGVNATGVTLADTWTYNGAWSELSPATIPPARYNATMTYDYKNGYVVMFGGLGASGTLSDTWKFVHGVWTKLTPAHSPPALSSAAMVWDTNDSYALLFGGLTSTLTASSETWSFVGGTWTQQNPSTSPTARLNPQLGYDTTNGWVILFGGETTLNGVFADTWNYSHGHWKQLSPTTSPPGVYRGSFTNDTSDGYLVLFGGLNSAGKVQGSTWTFVNSAWTEMAPAIPPSARQSSAAAYDAALSKVVLFGGDSSTRLGDTWTFHADVWVHVSTSGPGARELAMMTYDEADGYVLLFGGATTKGGTAIGYGDTWTYTHGHWAQLKPPVAPSARVAGALAYDQADGYVVLFGGESVLTEKLLNDTWTFKAGKWTEVLPSVSPAATLLPGVAYDATDGYLLLFGGETETSLGVVHSSNDTWTFEAGIWTETSPPACTSCGPQPSGRYGQAMAYDAWDGYVLLFGGDNLTGSDVVQSLSDTWTYVGGVWTNITATAGAPPSARAAPIFVYDSLDGYMLLYGGKSFSELSGDSDTWSFVGGTWTELSPATNPGGDFGAVAAFDPVDKTVVYLTGATLTGETWRY
jgi:hypothetical protein